MYPNLFEDAERSLRPLRPRQASAIEAIRQAVKEGHRRIVLQAPTGFGKCHGAGTEVVMYDGSLRKVEDVRPGDLLIGPDSQPRTVLNTVHGYGPLFTVTPKKGEPFVCNDVHVLSLKQTRFWHKNGGGKKGNWYGGKVVNLPLNEYLKKSSTFRHQHKLWRTAVDFDAKKQPLDPYVLGVLLGDGSLQSTPAVTTMDPEIVALVHCLAAAFGLSVRKVDQEDNRSSTYYLTTGNQGGRSNPLTAIIRSLALNVPCGEKFIPHCYRTGSRQQRLELLAGLIDTDGHVFVNQKAVEFANKSLRLIRDVEFVVRSLGFGCSRSQSIVNGVTYYRLQLHGDYRVIPTRIPRKQVTRARAQKKDVLMTGFDVEFIGNGDYYGFALDGDSLYLLRDFTVTHNTLTAAHLIASSLAKGNRPLFTCPAITLIDQTLKAFEHEGIRDIGVIQAKHERTDWRAAVQLASVQTLIRRPLPEVHFVLIDEVHIQFDKLNERLDGEEWKDKIVIGLTATPWAKGMGHRWTKLIIAATVQELINEGYLSTFVVYAPADDREPDLSKVRTVAGDFEEKGASAVMSDAVLVADVVKTWKERAAGLPTFLFAVDRAHAKHLQEKFTEADIPCGYIDAFTEREQRTAIFGKLRRGEYSVIASVGCLTTGVDEDVRCIVDAAPTKSEIRHVQKIGRGLRIADGKDRLLILDHAGNTLRLGMVTDIHHDHLDTHKPGERGEPYEHDKPAPKPKKCQKCHTLIPAGRKNCPLCGEPVVLPRNHVHTRDGELVLMSPDDPHEKRKDQKQPENKQQWYSELLGLARERGHSDGWAAHRFKEKFKEWPNRLAKSPISPGPKVLSFDKYCRIRYAKARQKAVSSQPNTEEYHGAF